MAAPVLVQVVAGVIIKQEGKYLLVQEKQPSAYGLWNLPAGKVDEGESIEQAAVREAKEEVGYDVELVRKLGVFQASVQSPVKHVFEARVVGGEFSLAMDEFLDSGWFSYKDMLQLEALGKLRSADWMLSGAKILESN